MTTYTTVSANKAIKTCQIIDNGDRCKRKLRARGLCGVHYSQFHNSDRKKGTKLLDKYALPPIRRGGENRVFHIIETTLKGICHIIDDGEHCTAIIKAASLCEKHYKCLERLNRLGQYALPVVSPRVFIFEIKKETPQGICRIIRDGEHCTNKVRSRGVCHSHRVHFDNHGIFEDYALEPKRKKKRRPYTPPAIIHEEVMGAIDRIDTNDN